MKLAWTRWGLWLLLVGGCTPLRQGVPTAQDGSSDAAAVDLAADTSPDAAGDTLPQDAPQDVTFDAGGETGIDASPDSGPDVSFDAGMDVAHDVALDAPPEVGLDARPDAGLDASTDTFTDTRPDTSEDARRDAGVTTDGADPESIEPPRPVAPLSTTWMTSGLVTFRWQPIPGQRAVVEVCSDARCASVERTFDGGTGASVTVPAALAQGNHWWRLYGAVGGVVGIFPSVTWQLVVEGTGTRPAHSAGPMVDVDGDGRRDVAVGAPGDRMGAGLLHIWRHSTGVMPGAQITFPGVRRSAGTLVRPSGDMNGDGLGDLAYVERETSDGDGTVLQLLGWRGFVPAGHASLRTFIDDRALGTSLASIGDFDGDGYSDLAVGQPPVDTTGMGRVLIYAGAPNGHRGWDGVTGPNRTWTVTGTVRNAQFAKALASVGDLNGDGYDDLVTSATGFTTLPSAFAGEVDVYFGNATGPAPSPDVRIPCPDPPGAFYGATLAGIGDVNGDGYPDLAIGAPGLGTRVTSVFIHYGGPSGPRTVAGVVLPAPDGVGPFGVTLAGVGDVTRDGFADVAVAEPNAGGNGRVYIYRGGAMGLRPTDRVVIDNPDPPGPFGQVIGSHGDIDGDGHPDLLVGAASWNAGTGRVYVFRGGVGAPESAPWRRLDGSAAGARFGESL